MLFKDKVGYYQRHEVEEEPQRPRVQVDLRGQSVPAEDGPQANSAANHAHGSFAFLIVETSPSHDRRNKRIQECETYKAIWSLSAICSFRMTLTQSLYP